MITCGDPGTKSTYTGDVRGEVVSGVKAMVCVLLCTVAVALRATYVRVRKLGSVRHSHSVQIAGSWQAPARPDCGSGDCELRACMLCLPLGGVWVLHGGHSLVTLEGNEAFSL